MSRPNPSPTRTDAAATASAAQTSTDNGYPPPAAPADISVALLQLLRKINAEVPPSAPLQSRALAAVQHFQRISADLATLADRPAGSALGSGPRTA